MLPTLICLRRHIDPAKLKIAIVTGEAQARFSFLQEIYVDAGDAGICEFYLRDALPFEDEQGLAVWPTQSH